MPHAILDRLILDRRAFMSLIERTPPALLQLRLREDAWSVIEIAEHVVLAERVVLGGLPEITLLREKARRSAIRRAIVLSVLTLGIPVEVPSPFMRPSGTVQVEELRASWNDAEAWLVRFAQRDDSKRRAVFEHPIAGALTLAEAARLDRAHIRRHRKQIEAILRSA